MHCNKQIVIPKNEKGKTLVKAINNRTIKNYIVFSFSFFYGYSICIRDFNNFYATKSSAEKSVEDFFETMRLMSGMETKELLTPNMKKQYHYNEFDNDQIIDRIEYILIEGYGLKREKVDEFERMYFEFSFGNGKRAIGTKIYDNIFQILFIDCNHLVCIDSSRKVKTKLKFTYQVYLE